MSGLGDQHTYRKAREAIDAGAPPPDERKRRKEPTTEELADPLLIRCRETHLAFTSSRPRDWELLHQRNAAWAEAEAAGRSLRAIARAAGVTHPTVTDQIWKHHNPGWREARDYMGEW